MKKTVIAVFSVSITAGTIYWGYTTLKDYWIKKLLATWKEEADKQKKEIDEKHLTKELDKLYLWEVLRLTSYSNRFLLNAPEDEMKMRLDDLKEKGITEKADLKSLEGIIFSAYPVNA